MSIFHLCLPKWQKERYYYFVFVIIIHYYFLGPLKLFLLYSTLSCSYCVIKHCDEQWIHHFSLFLFIPAPSEFVSLAEMEDALLKNLFQGYQRWVRPIQHANGTIKVRFGLKISQLVDVVRTHLETQTHTHALCLHQEICCPHLFITFCYNSIYTTEASQYISLICAKSCQSLPNHFCN